MIQREMLDGVGCRLDAASALSRQDISCIWTLLQAPYLEYHTSFDILSDSLLRLLGSNLSILLNFTNLILELHNNNERSAAIQDDLLNSVAEILVKVPINTGDVCDQRHEPTDESESDLHVSWEALSQFTKHHYILGRFDAIHGMLDNLRTQMSYAHGSDLHAVYVPFLHRLISLMLMWGVPFAEETYSLFFKSVLQAYFGHFIGPVPSDISEVGIGEWTQRAEIAWTTLSAFEDSYLPEILGSWYDRDVAPRMTVLKNVSEDPEAWMAWMFIGVEL
ncbi:hypothetical protein E8E13_001490 [Curvularia kusanoi]|uniref:Uncharacterized protein n=1 Tax=Curvularia kusanoi TaxID=90978 RepID=A0A9P4T4V5_CURKU|nr:hypothetical protein E8E13_001490 [Curvularia kusanoi]